MSANRALYTEEAIIKAVKRLLSGWRSRPAKAGRLLSGTGTFIVRQPQSYLWQNALPGAFTGRVNALLGENF
jgi:hypothetical protein